MSVTVSVAVTKLIKGRNDFPLSFNGLSWQMATLSFAQDPVQWRDTDTSVKYTRL